MTKTKIGLILGVAFLLVGQPSISLASADFGSESVESGTTVDTVESSDSTEKLDEGELPQSKTEEPVDSKSADVTNNEVPEMEFQAFKSASVGQTIAESFTDPKLAQAIAAILAGGEVHAVLTQAMVNSTTTLNLSSKNLQDLTGIELFTNLETLNVRNNQLTSLPESISSLVGLQALYLDNNQLTNLPSTIGSLVNLEQLSVSSNQLTGLPDSFPNLISLNQLDLEYNQLTGLPENIGQLTNLQYFYLFNNQISTLPNSIGGLVNLEEMDVSNNILTTLPENFSNLTQLVLLDLGNNRLVSLPDGFGGLTNLEFLSIAGNQLTSLPTGFNELRSLSSLMLNRNLLPTGYDTTLKSLGMNGTVNYQTQRQLVLKKGIVPYTIANGTDLNGINLFDTVQLSDDSTVSSDQQLVLTGYVDENGASIILSDYIKNGIIQKNGTIFAKVRATGAGIFPDNSDHAMTAEQLQLNFNATYYDTVFNLNGATGTVPSTQAVVEGELNVSVEEPTRAGYTFLGWNTAEDGGGTMWDFEKNVMPAENITLYAQWKSTSENPSDLNKKSESKSESKNDTDILGKEKVATKIASDAKELQGETTATASNSASTSSVSSKLEENAKPISGENKNEVASKRTLPNTGESNSFSITLPLLVLLGVSLLLIRKKRKI
ncbi:leucine-rich repeat domain-containing protein [Enterococcus rivorum]|uniref:leucine-rich repeat domain-containing protein n=1 Tax=Enterococcus rivorum TaxID=762845 RepID=UPI0014725553|nr:leucine-rich repeat domain-containing protein [Enterococcus rivorum]MBP2098484.1 putative repeat protein (TIGR02543 family)/LPXTG-motif cell wall-anchored protein [Enterococcus rivorum]